MKTFIALTFIGILTCAYSQYVEKCITPTPVMQNFEAPKFHNGTWYVTHVNKSPNDCQIITTSQNGGKSIVEFTFTYNGIDGKLHCEAPAETRNRLKFTCTFGEESIDTTIQIVMTTDYNDYALYYICSTVTSGSDKGKITDNYLVTSRRSVNEEIPVQLKSLTSKLNWQKCIYS